MNCISLQQISFLRKKRLRIKMESKGNPSEEFPLRFFINELFCPVLGCGFNFVLGCWLVCCFIIKCYFFLCYILFNVIFAVEK